MEGWSIPILGYVLWDYFSMLDVGIITLTIRLWDTTGLLHRTQQLTRTAFIFIAPTLALHAATTRTLGIQSAV